MLVHLRLSIIMVNMFIQIIAEIISTQSRLSYKSLTRSLTVTLARIEGNVSESTSIFIPTAAKVNAAIQPVLDEKPTWENISN